MESETSCPDQPTSSTIGANKNGPICIVVLGMAGSGKTTLVKRLTSHLYQHRKRPYVMNMDPAVHKLPYPANIDIRDTVNYREVMQQHKLGPNGAIITSLNLFATQFDQVIELIANKGDDLEHIVADTPGQIEVFTWSASGTIILESLASQFATMVVYVVDAARSQQPTTFMSNMLYACSILYRMQLPFIVVFNKCDIVCAKRLHEWITDFEKFHEVIDVEQAHSSSYMNDLTRSMSLVLDEFYECLTFVDFSAITGEGIEDLMAKIEEGREEYWKVYRPIYEKLLKERREGKIVQSSKKEDCQNVKALKSMGLTDAQIQSINSKLISGPQKDTKQSEETNQNADSQEESDDNEEDRKDFEEFWNNIKQAP